MIETLDLLPPSWEVICALCESRDDIALPLNKRIYTVISVKGRAIQMNTAAQLARGRALWFLHLDSVLTREMIHALEQGLASKSDALHYFRLAFASDGAGPMTLNAKGANLRSAWLGIPFGDQGLCLSATNFRALDGYCEKASYGEDHLLVWRARQMGLKLNGLDAELCTSARKYHQQGWWHLTLLYQWRWIRQALPQYLCLLSGQRKLRARLGK
ncbi:glycosyl transferase family 2 [Marinobacterium aestuarii]|uniref:glycosyl transferase family 2 n=1 Tax=Marinobacterium aestuarii TaxID=1821621 RepID=UPI000A684A01|nr:glycosyl transferase family 2 [Marinobacterium aestuarii]